MISLMRFYRADTREQEDKALDRMIETLPSKNEVAYHLSNEISQKDIDINDLKTKRIKSFYQNQELDR